MKKLYWEDRLIIVLQWLVCAAILGIIAMVAADAWIKENESRVARLQKHLYDVAYGRNTLAPAAPTGLRPNYGDLAEPKVRYFQDASQPQRGK